MAATEIELFERIDRLGIQAETLRHAPMFTVADAKELRGNLAGGHTKNLFLKDKKGALWLVVTLEDTQIDLKTLHKALGSARLSFGKPELLMEVLGVPPGSVTPFAVINAAPSRLNIVLEAAMLSHDTVNYHPLTNSATTSIRPEDLLAFIRDCGHDPIITVL